MRSFFPIVLALFACATPAGAGRRDFVPQASDFRCLTDGRRVEGHDVFVFGSSPRVVRKAVHLLRENRPHRRFPVGTILQLVPFEAMVKRGKGYNTPADDWEFFSLDVSSGTTKIKAAGRAEVTNVFNHESCERCHGGAKRFDLVCDTDHGCAPLGVSDSVIRAVQAGDPRCH